MNRLIAMTALLLTACGGGAAQPDEGTENETAGSEQPAVWASMSQEERGQYMHDVVVPRMRPLFQEFDAEEYAEFGCPTCHGENAREVEFHMPNTLHPLDPAQLPALFQSEDPEVQRLAQFMSGPVEHTMAELLGEEPYDMETQQGFGCFGCHATAQ